jgi:bacterioferritin-associated ferredoxin
MYVCICNGIRETEVRKAACAVAGDAEAIYLALGKEPQCRMCLEEADAIVADARERSNRHFFV